MRVRRLLPALLLALLVLTGCDDKHLAAPQGFCADIFGDGQNGRSAGLLKTVWPGQVINDYDNSKQVANFLPCQPRNYKVTLHKNEGGDRDTPTKARTNQGTQTLVAWTMYFTPNQSVKAQGQFSELCGKYQCWYSQDDANNPKAANPHWMLLLHENVGTAGDEAIQAAEQGFGADAGIGEPMKGFDNSIWSNPTIEQKQQLADAADKLFAKMAAKRTGYDQDLFCGSGSVSFWKKPKKAGDEKNGNKYTCGQVRFVIDDVVNADPDQQKASQQQQAAVNNQDSNKARQNAADKLYGKGQGGFWLGVQDAISSCAQVRSCNINVGNPPAAR